MGDHYSGASGRALDVLYDSLEWETDEGHWKKIDVALDKLRRAIASKDPLAMRQATTALDALSPRRANEAGKDSGVPPPEPVRDRLNDTIHDLKK
jgi:hypothetical protein